ncbi:MAG: 2-oxoglutarate dehydrogenase E1 component [Bacteroidales bacterium]|nr:2-oxoglutarate dehydrogenase E1 component [Bacteroidales bacterium]
MKKDEFSFLGNIDIETIEALYKDYLKDPGSVEESWQQFFKGFDFARHEFKDQMASETLDKEFKVINLIDAYRKRGHLFTKTNPVRTRRKYFPTLDLENYGLSDADLDTVFHAGKEIGIGAVSLREITDHLQQTYASTVGAEYMFIRSPEKIKWLSTRMEESRNVTEFTVLQKKEIFMHLRNAIGFEKFIHKRFTGQKRFSLEGAEVLIPALIGVIERGSALDVQEFMIGMAHRGRLNVLANVLQKPYENIFKEFEGEEYEAGISLGDVKYHLGYVNDIRTIAGKKVRLNMAPNPSHLEAVSPIIEGLSRARIDHKYEGDYNKVVPILIHGDAAISSQGVVYELIQMYDLPGYKTGGTIHLVINNQVGFTTNYLDGRSSTYCTDIGKVTKAPIFHVNGDEVEALLHTVKIAMDYRQRFHTDVFIDILSYRKYGHNEGDEPRFTQPLLYKAIAKHPNTRDIYAEHLIESEIYSKKDIQQFEKDYDEILEGKLKVAKGLKKVYIQRFLKEDWKGFKYASQADFRKHVDTGVRKENLLRVANEMNKLPSDKPFFSKITRLVDERKKAIKEDRLDWALAELLAYGTLLTEGFPVRISGQDSIRGTFSHRHAGFVIEDTDQQYFPLQNLTEAKASFEIYNSPLSEYGVLGFEYGYALAVPNGLTIWEAQFGDFHNVAQVIIDQYISSAEEKWGLMNGLVLLLPHGFEGQGPEHSSARIERFLSMAARNNMHLVNCTTPANLFHALRKHLHANFRTPLIIFTPKSLLRHPKCVSPLEDFENDTFHEIIDDPDVDINEVRRVVYCSGKVYYDLLARKEEFNARDVALVRIEQLHPFPIEQVNKICKKYQNNLLSLWVQEEPENMGPWRHIQQAMGAVRPEPVTRQPSGSPATGLHQIHLMGQEEIIQKVFRRCDCELKNIYCGLQCVVGKSRKEILKAHQYFQKN